MNAYEIMHEWDRAVGNDPRSDTDLDRDIPPQLTSSDYEGWKALLESGNIPAIKEGMKIWGMPIQPLPPFEVDDAIGTIERPYSPN